jgi:hypothetical protein
VKKHELTQQQKDQLDAAISFFGDAQLAREADDLMRASVLAEKARIIAEELRAALSK